jgi:hypothetical protein
MSGDCGRKTDVRCQMTDINNFRFRISEFRTQGGGWKTLDPKLWERLPVAMKAIKMSQQDAAPTNLILQKCSLHLNIF